MKLNHTPRNSVQGNTYLVVLSVTGIAGTILASYLTMVGTQNYYTMRSQAWNRSITVSEAGVEEALSHLNKNGTTNFNLFVDGWWNWGGVYSKKVNLDDAYADVTITKDVNPVITSRGYTPTVQNYYTGSSGSGGSGYTGGGGSSYQNRAVQVLTRPDAKFAKAILVQNYIDMNGNNVRVDSFDSTDPLHSTNGIYYAPWAKDGGDVATTAGLTNFTTVSIGNANVYGHVATGPKGTVATGANGGVGSFVWQNAGNHGVQPGWSRDDMNYNFFPVTAPFSGGSAPGSGWVGGTNYALVIGNGNYVNTSNLKFTGSERVYVFGNNANWWCKAGLAMVGQGGIIIAPGATLNLYVGDTTGSGVSLSVAGQGIISAGYATNCVVYGLPSCTSMSYSGNAAFTGAVYAPNADFTLGGGGSDTYDFVGAIVGNSLTMNGKFNIHYDESLSISFARRGYIVVSWNEI
ncbi:MAG: hypothetical protein NTW03_05175 [Verrucomicrobia bacterium]|nr:hypothetical protein [Verrucomicrobiota bacterium]